MLDSVDLTEAGAPRVSKRMEFSGMGDDVGGSR
jgi:hypothetical protein